MNPVPFLLRGFAKWQRIKTDVDNWAREWDYPTYTEAPTLYRFSGWGFDFSKGVACNVLLHHGNQVHDAGRFPR